MAQKSKGTAKAKPVAKAPARAKAAANKEKNLKPKPKVKVAAPTKVAAAPKPAPESPVKEIAKAKAALKAATPEAKPLTEAPAKPEKAARGRKISVVANATEAAGALAQKWSTLFKKSEQIEAKPYNMRAVFEEKTAIVHKVLGWGYILANRNDRLEVLFKDGIKYLISNYKP